MALHKATKLRLEWRLLKGADEIVCEVWARGAGFESRLVKSGEAILLEEARSDSELRLVQQRWRSDLELLGWKWAPLH